MTLCQDATSFGAETRWGTCPLLDERSAPLAHCIIACGIVIIIWPRALIDGRSQGCRLLMANVLYTALDPEKQEIRLLILWPGSLDIQPHCDIEVCSLKDGHFAALSYVWGDEKERKDIIVSDQTISVTANLELALRYLQCKDLIRIWVDALCINQSDAVEKALQVGSMSQIYSKAHTTYMWIGAPVYYSDVAMNLIRKVLSVSKLSWTNRQIFALRQLIERPYWTRVWVVQESFYSRHAIVKCGHDEVDFDLFYDLGKFMDFHNDRPRTDRCSESTDENIIKFVKPFPFKQLFSLCPRHRRDEPIRIDIFRWLNYTDAFSSTLPRDRIFAFLNLSFLTDTQFIKPDYSSKPDRRIFSEVTGYIMRSRVTSHDYICSLQLRQVGKLLSLPSWVPDWTIQSHHASFVPPPHAPKYSAGQGEFWIDYEPLGVDILGSSVQFRFSADFETLVIRGVVVDSVSCAVPIADGDELARQPNFRVKRTWVARRQVLDACRNWQATALTFHAYGAGLSEAISRTAVANVCPEGTSPAHEDCGTLFEQWKDAVEREDKALLDTKLLEFDARVVSTCELRAFCLSEKGRVGLVPSLARERDLICLFQDGKVPFVLRETDGRYRWIGEAYIHGMMFGEALRDADPSNEGIFHIQ